MTNLTNFTPPQTPSEQAAFNDGLELYFADRDKPAQYTPPAPAVPAPQKDAVKTVMQVAKPATVATAAISGIGIIVNAAIGVASAVLQFINEYALVIGGGAFAVSLLYSWAVSLKTDKAHDTHTATNAQEGNTTININVNAAGKTVEVKQ